MDSCRNCGARLYDGASFCARCYTPEQPSEEEVAGLLREVDAAGGRWQEPRRPAERWKPAERHSSPSPQPVFSRWRSGTFSFPLSIKVAITALLIAVPFVAWSILPLLALELVLVWSVVVVPLVLRDLWRRTRVG